MMTKTTKFKDLSLVLKVAAVGGLFVAVSFIIGFITGLVG